MNTPITSQITLRTFEGTCALGVLLMLIFVPGAPVVPSFLTFIILGAATIVVYRRTSGSTTAGEYALAVATTLLAVGVTANVWYFTTACGGTDAHPVLQNPDAARNWDHAMSMLGYGGAIPPHSHGYYPMISALVMRVTGPSITAVLMLQMAYILIALVCASVLGYRLTGKSRIATVSLIATMSVCYYMVTGTVFVKDSAVICSLALTAVGITTCGARFRWVPLLSGILLLAVARTDFLWAIVMGIIIYMIANRNIRPSMRDSILCCMICILMFLLGEYLNITPIFSQVITGSTVAVYGIPAQHQAYFNLIGDYASLPFPIKILLMPFTAAVQFLIPFPWNFSRDLVFGPSQIYAHIAYPWYLFGTIFIYGVARMWHKVPAGMRALSAWAILCWLTPCITSGGTVSRYALPAITLMAPMVAYTLLRCYRMKSLYFWIAVVATLLTVALFISHRLQHAAM